MEHNFKVGDWVVRTDCKFAGMQAGDIDQIDIVEDKDCIVLRKYITKYDRGHNPEHFRLARPEEIPGYIKSDRVRFYVDTLEDKDVQNLLVNKAKSNNIPNCDFGYPEAKYLIYDSDNNSGKGYWFNSHHTNVDTEYTIAQAIEFFKQPEFKVGDWVYYLGASKDNDGADTEYWVPGKVGQVTGIDMSLERNVVPTLNLKTGSNAINAFRLATPEEIKKATVPQIKVGDYTAEYNLTAGLVGFGCKRYAKNYIKDLYDIMTRLNIAAIKIEGEMVSSHQIEQIYKGFLG